MARTDVPDAVWPSDNVYGIPTLLSSMQADAVDVPVVVWGSVSRKKRMKGTWCFYTDDYRFEGLWSDPSKLLETGCVSVVEPNFGICDDFPVAVVMWQVYRKRWLARHWQGQGVRVFVDLNTSRYFAEDNLLGVPRGWAAFATRGYDAMLGKLKSELSLARSVCGGWDGLLFVVYGGGQGM